MALRYRARLTRLGAQDAGIRLAEFVIGEGYSTGWSGTGVVVAKGKTPMTPGTMISAVMASGVLAGTAVDLALDVSGGPLDGTNVRTWPCVVAGLRPFAIDEFSAGCDVHLVDPVSYLAEQPVWGAYRRASAAEAVGGALSLATGGDGKPTTTPVLSGLPPVQVVAEYRDALDEVPYAIASGQRLGDWLAEFLAMLGLRAELQGHQDGRTDLTLTDAVPRGPLIEMSVVTPSGTDPPSPESAGPILIGGHTAFPGVPLRGALLDDPTKGSVRPLLSYGAVGTVLTEAELDVDEAAGRVYQAVKGVVAGMLTMTARTRLPGIRPGEVVRLSRSTHGFVDWQIPSVSHEFRNSVYENDATLIRGDIAWHPELPLSRPPIFVTAVVNGGHGFDFQQPVPRDRLGRIKVTFPFTPTPAGEAGTELAVADTSLDGRVTLDDFDDAAIQSFTEDRAMWEEERGKYDAGKYNDPYPGRKDDELTKEELERREELRVNRDNAITYGAYKKASMLDLDDADRDGVLSRRDELVSEALSKALRDEEERQRLQDLWDMRHETPIEEGSLAEEYGRLFGDETDDIPDDVREARDEAELMAERWPPRIPLPVVKPMAGALHGFIVAHRHGDTCRVAVHSPFSAEIVGFQYRDDRKINADLSTSLAGLVVEHNYAQAWSGLVFRRTGDMTDADS